MTIRITWKRVFLALAGLLAAVMVFAWSGLMQISASSGHWQITDWFLHWTMRNSVRTYSTFQSPEQVTSDEGLVSAAGHFRQACQVCHGAPGVKPSPVMQSATPPAPDLAKTAGEWNDRELFWIIKHGVKFTAMPAWPASGRDDEIRRMTAFVRRLPDMSAEHYRALTHQSAGPALDGVRPGVLDSCTGCHGADGRGLGQPDIPILGGQRTAYLAAALRDYASGRRKSAVMQVAATSLHPKEIEILARQFGTMPGLNERAGADHQILRHGQPERQLPACYSCHASDKPSPVIIGQKASYTSARLNQWRGDPGVVDAKKSSETMAAIARRIPIGQVEAISATLSGSSDQADR